MPIAASSSSAAAVLTRTQQEQALVLEGVTELRNQVEKVLALLTEDDGKPSAGWFWLTMDDQARAERFSELFDWAETVLPQRPSTRAARRPATAAQALSGSTWPPAG